jgi:hypothetical protein
MYEHVWLGKLDYATVLSPSIPRGDSRSSNLIQCSCGANVGVIQDHLVITNGDLPVICLSFTVAPRGGKVIRLVGILTMRFVRLS